MMDICSRIFGSRAKSGGRKQRKTYESNRHKPYQSSSQGRKDSRNANGKILQDARTSGNRARRGSCTRRRYAKEYRTSSRSRNYQNSNHRDGHRSTPVFEKYMREQTARHWSSSRQYERKSTSQNSSRPEAGGFADDEFFRDQLHEPIKPSDIRVAPRKYGPTLREDAIAFSYRRQAAFNTEFNKQRSAYARADAKRPGHASSHPMPTWRRPAGARYNDAIMYAPRGRMLREEPRANHRGRTRHVQFAA